MSYFIILITFYPPLPASHAKKSGGRIMKIRTPDLISAILYLVVRNVHFHFTVV